MTQNSYPFLSGYQNIELFFCGVVMVCRNEKCVGAVMIKNILLSDILILWNTSFGKCFYYKPKILHVLTYPLHITTSLQQCINQRNYQCDKFYIWWKLFLRQLCVGPDVRIRHFGLIIFRLWHKQEMLDSCLCRWYSHIC